MLSTVKKDDEKTYIYIHDNNRIFLSTRLELYARAVMIWPTMAYLDLGLDK